MTRYWMMNFGCDEAICDRIAWYATLEDFIKNRLEFRWNCVSLNPQPGSTRYGTCLRVCNDTDEIHRNGYAILHLDPEQNNIVVTVGTWRMQIVKCDSGQKIRDVIKSSDVFRGSSDMFSDSVKLDIVFAEVMKFLAIVNWDKKWEHIIRSCVQIPITAVLRHTPFAGKSVIWTVGYGTYRICVRSMFTRSTVIMLVFEYTRNGNVFERRVKILHDCRVIAKIIGESHFVDGDECTEHALQSAADHSADVETAISLTSSAINERMQMIVGLNDRIVDEILDQLRRVIGDARLLYIDGSLLTHNSLVNAHIRSILGDDMLIGEDM